MLRFLIFSVFLVALNAACTGGSQVLSKTVIENANFSLIRCNHLGGSLDDPNSKASQYLVLVLSHQAKGSKDDCFATNTIKVEDDAPGDLEFVLSGAHEKCEELGGEFAETLAPVPMRNLAK